MACRQLRHAPVLAEVATAVGFYDQSALNKHFKRCYGITPAQFARAAAAGLGQAAWAIFANTVAAGAAYAGRHAPLLP